MPTTVAIVSLGTTPGLRVADAALAGQIEACGVACRIVRVRIGATGRLRRQITVTDLVESLAAARAARAARGADAVVLCTVTAAYLPRPDVPYAIRFDAPAARTRLGPAGAWQRAAERRALRAAPLLLPYGESAAAAAREIVGTAAGAPRVIPLPVPIAGAGSPRPACAPATARPGGSDPARSGGGGAEADQPPLDAGGRDIAAVTYGAYPKLRRLEIVAEAWARVGAAGERLVVAGLTAEAGRAHLRARGVAEPPGLEWAGALPHDAWLALLRRARAFVSATAREGYGQAALEALAAGTPVATTAGAGAYEALALLQRFDPALVSAAPSADALAAAWRHAAGSAIRARLAVEGPALMAPYAPDAVAAVVAGEVLPALGVA